jgi:hypothetical protein
MFNPTYAASIKEQSLFIYHDLDVVASDKSPLVSEPKTIPDHSQGGESGSTFP